MKHRFISIARLLNKLFPNPNKRAAVFTTYFLIAIGMMVVRVVPDKIGDNQAYLNFVLAALFLLISGETVKYMVEGAIDDAANQKIDSEVRTYKSQIESYRTSLRAYKKSMQNTLSDQLEKEYRLTVIQAGYPDSYELKVMEDPLLGKQGEDILARESITRGLGEESDVLQGIAGVACREVLGLQEQTESHLRTNTRFLNFRRTIYICLKAWLMLSIKNNRPMDVSRLIPASLKSQNISTEDCIDALEYIRDYIIDRELLNSYLEQRYRETSRILLKDYLTQLANLLRCNQENLNLSIQGLP